jgi:hypothetical protein
MFARTASGQQCRDDMSASLEEWRSRLSQETRDRLIAHTGEAVPAPITEEIRRAGGVVTTDAWWVGEDGPTGLSLSEEAIGWMEEVANGETPDRRGDG